MPGLPLTLPAGFNQVRGPSYLFVGLAKPAVGSHLTLTLDAASGFFTPDATQNPSGVYVGCTQEGWTIGGSPQTAQEFCDESPIPEFTVITQDEFVVEGELRRPFIETVLPKLTTVIFEDVPGASPPAKYYYGGGAQVIPTTCAAIIFKDLGGTDHYGYLLLYAAQNVAGFSLSQINSESVGRLRVRLNALPDPTRPIGKQAWEWGFFNPP